jgi:hypothetical protein
MRRIFIDGRYRDAAPGVNVMIFEKYFSPKNGGENKTRL